MANRCWTAAIALDLIFVQLLCGLMRFHELAIRSSLPRYRLAYKTRIGRLVSVLHDEHSTTGQSGQYIVQ